MLLLLLLIENPSLIFDQNRVINSWDKVIAIIFVAFVFVFVVHVVVVIVVVHPRNLPLKFGQNQVGNSWNIADVEFPVDVVGGWVVVVVCKVFFMTTPT